MISNFLCFRPTSKLEGDTVNKLSYLAWTPTLREDHSLAKKNQYQPPKEKFAGDSVYHTSFAPPGHYIDDCDLDCPERPNTALPLTYNDCKPQSSHTVENTQ